MTSDRNEKWVQVHDDLVEIEEMMIIHAKSISPYLLARSQLSITRLSVFVHMIPFEQARSILWSARFRGQVHALMKYHEEDWSELEFPPIE